MQPFSMVSIVTLLLGGRFCKSSQNHQYIVLEIETTGLSLAKELCVWYTQYFASVLVSTFFSYRLSGHRYSFFSGDLYLIMS
ncbi:hypothetical protein BDR07DRAFT_1432050, partial [Suillus spraguei]